MPNLLAMSFEGELTPSFDLKTAEPGATRADGWGLGYYPAGEPSASVLKEPAPQMASLRAEVIKAWEHVESSTFMVHIRTATWGSNSDANTQPFSRVWGGREWLFGHSGSLAQRPTLKDDAIFEPVGSTDSEVIFCDLMNRIAEHRWRSLADVDAPTLAAWFKEINDQGTLNMILTDGRDLCVAVDRFKAGLHLLEFLPPYEKVVFKDSDLEVDLTRRGVKSRKGVVISSRPLEVAGVNATWRALQPGQLLLIRQGSIRLEQSGVSPEPAGPGRNPRLRAARSQLNDRVVGQPKQLSIVHRTVYGYAQPVERSMHVLRLTPMHDRLQTVLSNEIDFSVQGHVREYEDVFGNRIRRVRVDTPFTQMAIEGRSKVQLLETAPLDFRLHRSRSTIPLVWMPWQRHMLNPYLLPPELPESELYELTEYAMSFVNRNGYDLLDTLLDVNATIFEEYKYTQGATTLATTPFQVYASRTGVCQDFANLFICMMRLLGVPARYVCGYLYTGPKNPNQRQGEASHAWAQVYLPEVGWKGFDPTNGIVTHTDHVRVAVGRSYSDATPTSGTIFVGGGAETLSVDVRVEISE